MKIPSLEEAAMIFVRALQAFEAEIEEAVEALNDRLREVFG